MANRPGPEIDVSIELVRRLLDEQFPSLARLPLCELSTGWDNTSLRLGDELVVRVPHRQAAAQLILHEQRWLPELAERIDLAIPAPTHCGRPSVAYPRHWSITPWLAGREAAGAELADPRRTARVLGRFLRQLHVDAPPEAPTNPYRGCPLRTRAASFEANLAALDPALPLEPIAAVFHDAGALPDTTERVWLHGDLHCRNMLVDDGELTAVIDWGDIGAGDRATDLASAFMLVPDHVDIVRSLAGTDDDWVRARGWAAHFAVVYLANSDDDPVINDMGRRLLDTVLASAA